MMATQISMQQLKSIMSSTALMYLNASCRNRWNNAMSKQTWFTATTTETCCRHGRPRNGRIGLHAARRRNNSATDWRQMISSATPTASINSRGLHDDL